MLAIKKAKLEYITTKTDNNNLSYFKIKDKSIIQKLDKYSEDSDIKLPFFSSNKRKSKILKSKQMYVKVNSLPNQIMMKHTPKTQNTRTSTENCTPTPFNKHRYNLSL
jgi:hypothetical protein